MIFRRLFATALLALAIASPALAATTVKSGQTITGATAGGTTTVDQSWAKLCADGTTVTADATCPQIQVTTGGVNTVINGSTSTNGQFTFGSGTASNWTVSGYDVNNVYRVIEASGAVENGVVENMNSVNLQRAFARFHGTKNLTIRHITAKMRDAPVTALSNFPVCITTQGEANMGGLWLDDVHCSGFYMKLADQTKYGNGDGADLDDQNAACSVKITNSTFDRNSDGGIDNKCPRIYLDHVYNQLNARNFRLWYGGEAGELGCGDAQRLYGTGGVACVWVENTTKYGYPLHIAHLTVNQTKPTPIIVIDGSAKVIIDSCTLNVPAGTPLHKGKLLAGSSFGPGCVVP